MKKNLLLLGLVTFLGLSAVSCSTDDSYMDTQAGDTIVQTDNGDKDLPKDPMRP